MNNTILEYSEMAFETASNSRSENGCMRLQLNEELIQEMSNAFKSCTNGKGEELKILHLKYKVT